MKPSLVTKSFAAFALFIVAACAVPGSYVNSRANGVEKTYRYDEGGKKVLVYEIDRTGELIVHDPNDKMAQMRMAGRKGEQKAEAADAARQKKIMLAPKRDSKDPIFVNIKSVEFIGDKLKLTEKDKQNVRDSFRKAFENDSVIRLTPEDQTNPTGGKQSVRSAFKDLGREVSAKKSNADVDIVLKVTYGAGIGGHKGKLVEVPAMAFTAMIINRWMRDQYEEKGGSSTLDIPGSTSRLAERIKRVIRTDIGPNIPADRTL